MEAKESWWLVRTSADMRVNGLLSLQTEPDNHSRLWRTSHRYKRQVLIRYRKVNCMLQLIKVVPRVPRPFWMGDPFVIQSKKSWSKSSKITQLHNRELSEGESLICDGFLNGLTRGFLNV